VGARPLQNVIVRELRVRQTSEEVPDASTYILAYDAIMGSVSNRRRVSLVTDGPPTYVWESQSPPPHPLTPSTAHPLCHFATNCGAARGSAGTAAAGGALSERIAQRG